MWGRAGSTLGRTTHVMRKFVSGMMMPRMVRNPMERYSLGTDSIPDMLTPTENAYALCSFRIEPPQ